MKKTFLIGGLLGLLVLLALAASVPFSAFNGNQFNTNGNVVSIKSGALVTNFTVAGTFAAGPTGAGQGPNITASGFAVSFADSSGNGLTWTTATLAPSQGSSDTGSSGFPWNNGWFNNITDFGPTTNRMAVWVNHTLSNGPSGTDGQTVVYDAATPGGFKATNFPAGGGSGTVTSFSAGNLNPLFTTSVATATTTPALTFTVTPSTNLGSGTNFDCKSAPFGYRATTNTSIAFQLTNETDGITSAILLFDTGATPPAQITITPSTGRTNIYVAGQATYAPSTNATLKIVIEQYPSNNIITFIDNYK